MLLAGCAGLPPEAAAPAFPLLPPGSFGATLERQQQLRVAAGGTQATLQCVLRIAPEATTLIALGPLGQRLFTITHDAAGVHTQAGAPAPGLPPPEQILADLQLALWPLPVLDVGLAGTAWQVVELRPGTRRVLHADRLVAEVHHAAAEPWNGRLWLVNLPQAYSLDIESRALP